MSEEIIEGPYTIESYMSPDEPHELMFEIHGPDFRGHFSAASSTQIEHAINTAYEKGREAGVKQVIEKENVEFRRCLREDARRQNEKVFCAEILEEHGVGVYERLPVLELIRHGNYVRAVIAKR